MDDGGECWVEIDLERSEVVRRKAFVENDDIIGKLA